jgi:effector-binding domain-containing protein
MAGGSFAPSVLELPARPYVGVSKAVTMTSIAEIADRLPAVFGWLGSRGIEPAGAPFFRYNLIDMERRLEMEVGVPLTVPVVGDGEIIAGTLPAGRYAVVQHVGHPDELLGVTSALLEWAEQQGMAWDVRQAPDGELWAGRLEIYHTDPRVEPDMAKWETELQFRLAD